MSRYDVVSSVYFQNKGKQRKSTVTHCLFKCATHICTKKLKPNNSCEIQAYIYGCTISGVMEILECLYTLIL